MEEKKDMVNHPDHYTAYDLENLVAIRGSMSRLEYMGFLKGSSLKYLYRYRLKGRAKEDLEKAKFYLTEMINETILEVEVK